MPREFSDKLYTVQCASWESNPSYQAVGKLQTHFLFFSFLNQRVSYQQAEMETAGSSP